MSRRRQLSLYLAAAESAAVEAVRAVLDPAQHALVPAHVTLCREDEFEADATFRSRLRTLRAPALRLRFGRAESFHGHGIVLPCVDGEPAFRALRQAVLGSTAIRQHAPHITLAHPRNPRAPGNCLATAWALLDCVLRFESATLIEQQGTDPWQVLEIFRFVSA